ncbi:MAG: SusD/RagB family nutrient-binding outer membrane lipoprotein [Cyclobacteriaceae bacterium]|nr:SusD/RagB family nutrient-binding outer membrane lipoprotein [Cyclobacteriaceae bacterium]
MNQYIKIFLSVILAFCVSCEELVDDINDNPNDLTTEDVDAAFFLTGAMLANTVSQAGHLNRISGLYSGQLVGYTSLYSNIYGYSLSTAETVSSWNNIYIGIIPNVRTIRERAPGDLLLVGISKVLEAHAIGSIASLCGDVPYSQVFQADVEDPQFDNQMDVFNALISLLDNGISDLDQALSRGLSQDIYFEGDADKWKEAAYTLKARYHLQMKDYAAAYAAAQNGISGGEGSMKYFPRGDAALTEGDKNLFNEILAGSRTGDIGNNGSYLMQLVDPADAIYRGNAKTDETARFGYYAIDENGASNNLGIIEQFEPHNLVTYRENLLILAEAAARTIDFNTALGHLNECRQYLNTGDFLNDNFIGEPFLYADYVAADFAAGGMENMDNIDDTRALLREIIEERYISGFGMYIPFNDARRLRKSDGDIAVPIPFNTTSATQQPERLPYSDEELFANSNAPSADPGLFVVTQVNQ